MVLRNPIIYNIATALIPCLTVTLVLHYVLSILSNIISFQYIIMIDVWYIIWYT